MAAIGARQVSSGLPAQSQPKAFEAEAGIDQTQPFKFEPIYVWFLRKPTIKPVKRPSGSRPVAVIGRPLL